MIFGHESAHDTLCIVRISRVGEARCFPSNHLKPYNMKKIHSTENVTAEVNVELTAEQVMELIAKSQASLRKSIRQHNYDLGLQLTKEDQDEILAEVNYKAALAAGSYNPEKAKVETWLSSIAYNVSVTYLTKRTTSSSVSVRYIDESDDDGYFDDRIRQMHYRIDEAESQRVGFLGQERKRESILKMECLNDAILSLSERDQKVVCYRLQGMSGREMAERLGISEGAQRKLVSDMRRRLGDRLEEMHFEDIADRTDRYRNSEVRLEEAAEEMFGFMYASRSEMNG